MTTYNALEPCPFCGGSAKIVEDHWRDGNLCGGSPFCTECGAQVPRYWPKREAEAIAAWNRRAPVDDHPEIIGGIEAKVMTYNHAHLEAIEMGYPSLTEALEHLSELRGVDDQVVEQMARALEPFVEGYSHTLVFLKSREKMHRDGLALYDADVERAADALAAYRKGSEMMSSAHHAGASSRQPR